jgi:uncharacterized C2H2 Zn-finger protein
MEREREDREAICPRCGNTFRKTRSWQVYDTSKCRWDDWNKKNPRKGFVEGRKE